MKFNNFGKFMQAIQRKNVQVFIRPLLREGKLKLIKNLHHLICLLMESLKILCFRSVAPMVCMFKNKQDHHFFN